MPSKQNTLEIQPCPTQKWLEFYMQDPTSTFFQSPKWYEITAPFVSLPPKPLLFSWKNEKAVLPLCGHKKIFTFLTTPYGTYTGLLTSEKLSQEFRQRVTRYLAKKNIRIFINPFSLNPIQLKRVASLPTYTVDLNSGGKDIAKTWKKGHRDNLRMAQKQGLELREGGTNDVPEYFSLYLETVKRWKSKSSTAHNMALLSRSLELTSSTGESKLWLCDFEKKMIGGVLVFYSQNHIVAWHMANDPNYYGKYPNQFLYYHIMKDAQSRGYTLFDFNPSQDLPGVEKFKLGFGAKKNSADLTYNYNLLYQLKIKLTGG